MSKPNKTSYIRRIYKLISGFLDKLRDDHISAFSAQSSYFLILSVFPFIMLLLTLLKYTPISEEFLLSIILSFIPSSFEAAATAIINELYSNSGMAIISITAIAAIWSSSKGILSLIRGLNCIYDIKKERNYFLLRALASLYTLAFIIGIVVSLGVLVFGNSLLNLIHRHQPILYNIVEFIISLRGIYIPVFLSFIFIILYKLVPNKDFRFVDHAPGAIFSALGWEIFSYAYSIYIDYFSNHSYIYGSLTSIVLLLLWIYFCMYILFIGAEINVYFRRHFQKAKELVRQYKDERS
ncbi:MAG: YihY/virulence factor BrkB family protein [Lachnospiraceae bacterium]|nr:YihY/virulence factor BrkB family protein [Lachnospiraceae bacterium]